MRKIEIYNDDERMSVFFQMLEVAGINKNDDDSFLKLHFLNEHYSRALLIFCEKQIVKKHSKSPESTKCMESIYQKCSELLNLLSENDVQYELESAVLNLEYKRNLDDRDIANEENCIIKMKYMFNLAKAVSMLIELQAASEQCLEKPALFSKRGRPSLEDYYEFVFALSRTYVILSNKKFTCFRHKSDNNKYEPVTDGHKFIYNATEQLNADLQRIIGTNEIIFDDKNIYNACEKTVSDLLKWVKNKTIKDYAKI